MAISSGNLDELLNVTFQIADNQGLTVESYISNGVFPDGTLSTLTAQVTTGTGPTGVAGGQANIVGVDDSNNSITVDTYDSEGYFLGAATEYVLGFAGDSVLVSGNTSNTIDVQLGAGGLQSADNDLGIFSGAPLAVGSSIEFTADGSATGIACFAKGTLIQAASGEICVEKLAIGDLLLNLDSEVRAVRWIGHRSYDKRFITGNHLMLPITIRAGAFAENVPHSDLIVSPGHAMWIDGQLVPAWRLVNGVSITQAKEIDHVTYFHVELHQHDLLIANGAPAESFLDEAGLRGQFQNAAEFAAIYPEAASLVPLQSRLENGFALMRIQERIAARAGISPLVAPVDLLRGYVDQVGPERVCGWAQDVGSPEEPVVLEISVGGAPVLCIPANGWRADLRKAGVGSGCHSFDFQLPDELAGPVIVKRVCDGSVLKQTEAAQLRCAA